MENNQPPRTLFQLIFSFIAFNFKAFKMLITFIVKNVFKFLTFVFSESYKNFNNIVKDYNEHKKVSKYRSSNSKEML